MFQFHQQMWWQRYLHLSAQCCIMLVGYQSAVHCRWVVKPALHVRPHRASSNRTVLCDSFYDDDSAPAVLGPLVSQWIYTFFLTWTTRSSEMLWHISFTKHTDTFRKNMRPASEWEKEKMLCLYCWKSGKTDQTAEFPFGKIIVVLDTHCNLIRPDSYLACHRHSSTCYQNMAVHKVCNSFGVWLSCEKLQKSSAIFFLPVVVHCPLFSHWWF
jgi:hypothetical protein